MEHGKSVVQAVNSLHSDSKLASQCSLAIKCLRGFPDETWVWSHNQLCVESTSYGSHWKSQIHRLVISSLRFVHLLSNGVGQFQQIRTYHIGLNNR